MPKWTTKASFCSENARATWPPPGSSAASRSAVEKSVDGRASGSMAPSWTTTNDEIVFTRVPEVFLIVATPRRVTRRDVAATCSRLSDRVRLGGAEAGT